MSLYERLATHVHEITREREPSHGAGHMMTVAGTSTMIYDNELAEGRVPAGLRDQVLIVAWLHDVFDHKYDHDGALRADTERFLGTLPECKNVELVMKCIDYISYSRENNAILSGTPIDFDAELGEYAPVRHIVSDADKLEAIGKIGIDRCIEYNSARYLEAHGIEISAEQLRKQVLEHADEKLLRIHSEFMRTPSGRKLSLPRHETMVKMLAEM